MSDKNDRSLWQPWENGRGRQRAPGWHQVFYCSSLSGPVCTGESSITCWGKRGMRSFPFLRGYSVRIHVGAAGSPLPGTGQTELREHHTDAIHTSGYSKPGARDSSGFQVLQSNIFPASSNDMVFRHAPPRVLPESPRSSSLTLLEL